MKALHLLLDENTYYLKYPGVSLFGNYLKFEASSQVDKCIFRMIKRLCIPAMIFSARPNYTAIFQC